MKKKLIVILLSALFVPLSGMKVEADNIDSPITGYLDITVESNVNKVLFSYLITNNNVAGANTSSTSIVLPVKDFRCDNKIAYKDFITLLKAETYPDLIIDFPGTVLEQIQNSDEVTLKNVTINIAGVSREYDILCTAENSTAGDKVHTGTIKVDLADLGLRPPKKYFGIVKIKDEVIVKFGLGIEDRSLARK